MADTAMSYFVEHGLRVNLGLPKWLGNCLVEQGPFQRLISWLSPLALPMEVPFFWFWTHLPPHLRYFILMVPWHFWVLFHKVLPGVLVRRGMVDELSIEAHALGNILYWVRLIPVTKRRMRFSLNQLDSSCPPSLTLKREAIDLPARGVRGVYLHTGGENAGVIYWIFGGAFVGGSIKGSMGFAEQYGRWTGCDVFMIDMRLYPENGIQDAIIDACRGYEWLLTRTPAKKVLVYGLSSGGGIGLKLLQLAASTEDRATFFHAPSQKTPQPAGAILCGAWIRYTTPTYSMKEFTVVDWDRIHRPVAKPQSLQSSLSAFSSSSTPSSVICVEVMNFEVKSLPSAMRCTVCALCTSLSQSMKSVSMRTMSWSKRPRRPTWRWSGMRFHICHTPSSGALHSCQKLEKPTIE